MLESKNNYLKLHAPTAPEVVAPNLEDAGELSELCREFSDATGWPLRYIAALQPDLEIDLVWSAPVDPGVGTPPGHLRIDLGGSQPDAMEMDAAIALAEGLLKTWLDLQRTRHALWQREAELAASVPVVASHDDAQLLAERLESTLQLGAEAIGCDAAGLYLLDEFTSVLKLRSHVGLPPDALQRPARPLRGALADLEALLGHAVALQTIDPQGPWNAPEDFASAVCVPIASSSTILGTLWLYCESERPFSDADTNTAEIVAGRLAAELERESLLREAVSTATFSRQAEIVEQRQRGQLPGIAPPLHGWEVAGWTEQADKLGGAFHDWFVLDDGRLAVALGFAAERGLAGAMSVTALRTALRSHARHLHAPHDVLAGVNQTLWTSSAGDQSAALVYAVIDPHNGQTSVAAAGAPTALLLAPERSESLLRPAPLLGEQFDLCVQQERRVVLPGESLVLLGGTRSAAASSLYAGRTSLILPDADWAERLTPALDQSAEGLLEIARDLLTADDYGDRAALAIRYRLQ